MSGSDLIVNAVIALAAALVGGLVAIRLGQSIMLGFILGGVLIGPYTPGLVADRAAVEALADIGIIFLLFAVGVQLSLDDLLRVGRVAILGGSAQVVILIGLGYLVGLGLGWQPLESLFLGAVISNSSSTVLTKVLGERGQADAEHGRIGLAWSTVQDLSTIVLVVVLSALAGGGDGVLLDLFWATAKAALFLVLLVPVGMRVLPRLFEWVAGFRSREIFILAIAAVALGTAYASSLFGVSLALGAFVGGVVVGESDLSHQILGEVLPLRDVLAGLFFVSVGMLVDPSFAAQNVPLVLLALSLIVVAKGALVALITSWFGYAPRVALLTGATLAQSAEFSFLLASLGASLGVVSAPAFNLMLVGAAGSILLAPGVQTLAASLASQVERRRTGGEMVADATPDTTRRIRRRHTVICGYGRVGRIIGRALQQRGLGFVVIEQDQRLVRRLREHGIDALLGSADNRVLLDRADLETARVLVIAIPDALAARQIVEYARQSNPALDIVVRTHDADEMRFLERRGVNEAVIGELELALEMTRHTLRRIGVSAAETLQIIHGLRARAGAEWERETDQ